jgi:microsomal epoxide hydrolase
MHRALKVRTVNVHPLALRTLLLLAALLVVLAPHAASATPGETAAAATDAIHAWPADWDDGYVTAPDGVRIHYLEATPQDGDGAAPSLLFVPGWTLAAQIWQPQIDHFRAARRVVAMDPRSQGLSDRPHDGHTPQVRGRDVAAVIDELELAPVVPVCWSLAVAECVAVVEQLGTDRLAGLVLVDGLAGGEPTPEWLSFMVGWIGRLQRDREAGTDSFVRSMYRTPQSEAYLRQVTEQSLATPTDAMVALMVGGLTNDNREALASIDKPVLLVVSRSPYVPRYEEMRDRLPLVRFEIFDAGHALFIDQAERFNALLEEFLAGLDDGTWRGAEGESTGDGAAGDDAKAEAGR